MIFTQIISKLGLPDGFFNSLFGSYKFFVKALQDKRLKAVIYSGSREHCDSIRRDYVSDCSRELVLYSGGKNAVIVDQSAQLELAVELCLKGVIKTAGQLNSSTSQVFVPRQLLSQFNEALVARLKDIKIGPQFVQWSADSASVADRNVLGPLYSKKALEKFLRFQTMAKREASETLVWGKAIDAGSDGYFVTPGIHFFESFDASSAYQSNVFMCPDLSIYAYDSIEQAVSSANATAAPFIVSLIGADSDRLASLTNGLDAPNVLFNQATVDISLFDAAAGRNIAGGHRYAGFQVANLLTYPQFIFKG
jgi:acyl-CoA reductase-like NAD-dependent aldehyde dehydrogenase